MGCFVTLSIFVLVCVLLRIAKGGSLLGFKKLGINVLELQYVYVGKLWSKHLV